MVPVIRVDHARCYRDGVHVASVGGVTASRRPPEGLSRRVKGATSDGDSAGQQGAP
jgi:hypothetical protein